MWIYTRVARFPSGKWLGDADTYSKRNDGGCIVSHFALASHQRQYAGFAAVIFVVEMIGQ
jgi:hypothetical protein